MEGERVARYDTIVEVLYIFVLEKKHFWGTGLLYHCSHHINQGINNAMSFESLLHFTVVFVVPLGHEVIHAY